MACHWLLSPDLVCLPLWSGRPRQAPVCLAEDTISKGPEGTKTGQVFTQSWLVRIVEYGWNHPKGPVLLTLADLSSMLTISTVRINELLAEVRRTTGKTLWTKTYIVMAQRYHPNLLPAQPVPEP